MAGAARIDRRDAVPFGGCAVEKRCHRQNARRVNAKLKRAETRFGLGDKLVGVVACDIESAPEHAALVLRQAGGGRRAEALGGRQQIAGVGGRIEASIAEGVSRSRSVPLISVARCHMLAVRVTSVPRGAQSSAQ